MITLRRGDAIATGIFGTLVSPDMKLGLFTLEHAYEVTTQSPPIFVPKVPPGVYLCVRGQHQLAGMDQPFETFEITDVPGHTGILFHSGNINADSEGCVLLGLTQEVDVQVLESRAAFKMFMDYMVGVDSFQLTIE